jgi:trk/ktr system potassium uptake protein
MYILIAGGGKVGANLTQSVLALGHEVTLIEQRRDRFERLEELFEHRAQLGDATELFILERAGIARPPDLVVAVTGDDEDNIVICQMAREHFGVEKVIARVNDPRNQPLFDLIGISPTISATSIILAMIEHEVPEHGLIHLLELRKENLEIVEVQLNADSPSVGKSISRISLPSGSRLITVMRDGQAQMAEAETELRAGDQVLAVLEPGKEAELRKVLLSRAD